MIVERDIALSLLGLAHDLDLDTLDADIVEDELGTRSTLVVYPGTDSDDLVLVMLARLEVAEVLDEAADVVVGWVPGLVAIPS